MNIDKSKNSRIVFFGTPDLAVPVLKRLSAEGYRPVAVVTAPDQPVGRKKNLTPPPIKEVGNELQIPVLQPPTLKDSAFLEEFKALEPDLCIVVAYGKLIPQNYLDIPKFGFLNIHPSALPEYRGPAPIQAAIRDGRTETAISVMLLDKDMDHGPLLATRQVALDPKKYYPEIAQSLFEEAALLLIETLPQWLAGAIRPVEQDHSKATFTKLLDREDGRIDWKRSADDIFNQVRALSHEPGTWTSWKGKALRILSARSSTVCPIDNPAPGTVIHNDHHTSVMTGSCALILETVQIEGGKALPIAEFIRGHSDLAKAVLN